MMIKTVLTSLVYLSLVATQSASAQDGARGRDGAGPYGGRGGAGGLGYGGGQGGAGGAGGSSYGGRSYADEEDEVPAARYRGGDGGGLGGGRGGQSGSPIWERPDSNARPMPSLRDQSYGQGRSPVPTPYPAARGGTRGADGADGESIGGGRGGKGGRVGDYYPMSAKQPTQVNDVRKVAVETIKSCLKAGKSDTETCVRRGLEELPAPTCGEVHGVGEPKRYHEASLQTGSAS